MHTLQKEHKNLKPSSQAKNTFIKYKAKDIKIYNFTTCLIKPYNEFRVQHWD